MTINIREDLLPDTNKSRKIVKEIRRRFDLSYNTLSQNFNTWDTIEEHYRCFRVFDDDDFESSEKHGVQKIVVPIQFATTQVMTTFMMEVFTAIKPVLRVRGNDPWSRRKANVMELLLDYDYRGNSGYFTMQQWFLNAFRYGWCPIENSWGRDVVLKKIMQPAQSKFRLPILDMDFDIEGGLEEVKEWFTTFEGNKWQLVDPRSFFPDFRVPLTQFQKGEFCGRRTFIHDNELRKLDHAGIFFNTTKIKTTAGVPYTRFTDYSSFNDSQRDRVSADRAFFLDMMEAKRNRMHVNEQVIIECIPRDWDLDEGDEPEQWIFNLIDGTTIVRAEPSPFYRFNFEMVHPYPDIFATMSQGLMELSEPLADHLSFLFNSHSANVRKAINDMLVVDPSRVDLRDLLDPKAGKLIRLLPLAYGTDPSAYIKQLVVSDITQGHMNDAKELLNIWNLVFGTSPNMFGSVSTGRRTASELQGVMRSATSRMKMLADLFSSVGVAPLTEQMSILRQENTSEEQFVELAGHTALSLGVKESDIIDGFLKVKKDHLTGNFSFPAEEGVLPQDRQAAAELIMKAFETVVKVPPLTQMFDPVEMFKESLRQKGVHHIDDFLNRALRAQFEITDDPVKLTELVRKGKAEPMAIPGEMGRPNQGVRESQQGLDVNGYVNGAGIPRA